MALGSGKKIVDFDGSVGLENECVGNLFECPENEGKAIAHCRDDYVCFLVVFVALNNCTVLFKRQDMTDLDAIVVAAVDGYDG